MYHHASISMKIQGRAKTCYRMLDRYYRVVDFELVEPPGIRLVKAMVAEAKRNGGPYSRKLIWLWREAKNAGWDEDETAFWVLSGDWHDLRMGQDLTQVF